MDKLHKKSEFFDRSCFWLTLKLLPKLTENGKDYEKRLDHKSNFTLSLKAFNIWTVGLFTSWHLLKCFFKCMTRMALNKIKRFVRKTYRNCCVKRRRQSENE